STFQARPRSVERPCDDRPCYGARIVEEFWRCRSSRVSRPRCGRRHIHAARCPKAGTEMARRDSKVSRSAGYCERSGPQQLCRTALGYPNDYGRCVRILQDDAVERGYHHSKWFPASFHCRAFGSLAWPGGKKDEALCRLRAKANALCARGEPLRLGLGLWRRDSP